MKSLHSEERFSFFSIINVENTKKKNGLTKYWPKRHFSKQNKKISLVNAFLNCWLWAMELYLKINERLNTYILNNLFILQCVESFQSLNSKGNVKAASSPRILRLVLVMIVATPLLAAPLLRSFLSSYSEDISAGL